MYRERTQQQFPQLELTDDQLKDMALIEIDDILRKNGKSLEDYPNFKLPNMSSYFQEENRLILEELSYCQIAKEQYQHLEDGLNKEQREIYDYVLDSLKYNKGEQIFVNGHGGTGKTYIWKSILAKIRSEGKIALAVATSGIAALLLPGGRTAHSRFGLPLDITEHSTCNTSVGARFNPELEYYLCIGKMIKMRVFA